MSDYTASDYTPPRITDLGSLSELTLTPGGANGGAFGKGSITPDGVSGLIGNRSGG